LGLFASLLVGGLVSIPFVFLARIPYDVGGYNLAVPLTAIGTVLGLGTFFWLMVLISTFQHVSWILLFMELVKPNKTLDEEIAVLPEVA
jgi:hypothetical protein